MYILYLKIICQCTKEQSNLRQDNTVFSAFHQVKDIHSSNPKASNEVEKRLKEAENEKTKSADQQQKAQDEYGNWTDQWEEEHGEPPKAAARWGS